MSRNLLFVIAGALTMQTGCAIHGKAHCADGEQASVSELIYFGTGKPGGVVSSEEWAAFLSKSVTSRFPAGLTVWPAAGQWQSAQGPVVREASFVLNLVYSPAEASERAVRDLVSEYKLQFQQEAVLRVKSYACASL